LIHPKVYSYLRFSTPEQALGDSKRRQVDQAREWAAEHSMVLDEELKDEGVSGFRGANLQADTGLGGFLRAIRDGAVAPGSVLVVESLDRLSRDYARKAQRVLEDICDGGVDVVTLSDSKRYSKALLDQDPLSMIMSLLVFIRANEESETKAKRLRASWQNKRRQAQETGKRMTTVCPPWMKPEGEGFALIPERVAIIRRIFAETLSGSGQHAIAHRLTEEGVETWRRGRVWHRTYVKKLLDNPSVIGTAVLMESRRLDGGGSTRTKVAEVVSYYPVAIATETWERVRALLETKSAARGKHSGKAVRHLLAGLAVCPVCKGRMTRTYKGRGGGLPYLVCNLANTKGRCVRKIVKSAPVDAAIFARFGELLVSTPAASDAEGRLLDQRRGLDADQDAIAEELRDIARTRRTKTFTPAHRRREEELYALLRDVEERMDALRKVLANTSSPIVESRLTRLLDLLELGPQDDLTAANAAMKECFTGVVVDYRDGTLGFQWRHGGESWMQYDWSSLMEDETPHQERSR
jgi:DNA invertase Pin-like site-specific DNA recombinase